MRLASKVRRTPHAAFVVLLVALVFGYSACGYPEEKSLDTRIRASIEQSAVEARSNGWKEQAAALSDGVLTDVENRSLHSLYRECMAKTNIKLSATVTSPIDNRTLLTWETNLAELTAADSEPGFQCYSQFDAQSVLAERPGPMAAPLLRSVGRCLSEGGIELRPKARDVRAIATEVGTGHLELLDDCIGTSMRQEYPEIRDQSFRPPSIY